jgi:hypothetical protein
LHTSLYKFVVAQDVLTPLPGQYFSTFNHGEEKMAFQAKQEKKHLAAEVFVASAF